MTSPRRRWKSLSLRGFMVVIAALAIGLGWKVNKARAQKHAVGTIVRMGGRVVYDYEDNDLGRSKHHADSPYPGWLRDIVGDDFLHDVVFVEYSGDRIAPAEIASIRALTRLKTLSLNLEGFDRSTCEWINGLTELEVLELYDGGPTPSRDVNLRRLKKLRSIRIGQGFDVSLLDSVGSPVRLEELTLLDPRVSDEWLVPVSRFTSLNSLVLYGTGIGDAGIARLAELTKLYELDLSKTRVTDAAIPTILRLGHLSRFEADGSKITDEGRARLRKELDDLF